MSMRVFVNDTVTFMAKRMTVNVVVDYERRRLEPALNRLGHMGLSCLTGLGGRYTSGHMTSQPRL
jgi:hypothetical protein